MIIPQTEKEKHLHSMFYLNFSPSSFLNVLLRSKLTIAS